MSTYVNGRSGYPSILSFSSIGTTGTFVDMAGITSIGAMGKTRKTIPLGLLNTTDGYEQVIAAGETQTKSISISAIYLTTNSYHQSILCECMDAGTRIGYKVTVGTSTLSTYNVWYGDAYIEEYEMGELKDDKIAFKFVLKPTGKPIGPASSTT